jgi:hypothetical protein
MTVIQYKPNQCATARVLRSSQPTIAEIIYHDVPIIGTVSTVFDQSIVMVYRKWLSQSSTPTKMKRSNHAVPIIGMVVTILDQIIVMVYWCLNGCHNQQYEKADISNHDVPVIWNGCHNDVSIDHHGIQIVWMVVTIFDTKQKMEATTMYQ